MFRLLVAFCAVLSLSTTAVAQKTPAQLIAEINANFPDNTTGFITPALARTTLIDMVNSMATSIANPTPAAALGAKCDGAADDTAAFQSANTVLNKGGVVRVPDGSNCIIVGAVSYNQDGIYIVGGGISGRDSAGSTITCSTSSTANCISWTGGTAGGLLNLRVDASSRTGTACTVSVSKTSHLLFQNLFTLDNNTFCLTSTNTILLDNVTSIGPSSGGAGKSWINWIGTLASRSDVLIVQNSGYQGNNGGQDCILWDGLANTMTMTSVRCLNVVNGLKTTNVNGNNSNYPAFLQAYDFEVDGGTGPAMNIGVGGYYRCIHCDLFHSTNDIGVIIAGNNPGTIVRSVVFEGGRIGNSGKQCVTTAAQGVRFVNVDFGSCSLNGPGLFPAIEVQATAVDTEFIGGAVVDFGDGNSATPGIQLDSGSSRTAVIGLDLHYPAVPILDNSTGQDNLWLPFIGQQSFLSFGKTAGAGQLGYFYQINSGAATTVRVENPRTATSTSARFEMATGTPSSFADVALTDGATPQVSLTTGSGVTGGINLDASAAAGGIVSLKSASNQPVVITSTIPIIQLQPVASGSLPACGAGQAGWRATINNSNGGPFSVGAALSTGGGAVFPVFCNGSAWVYG